MSHHIKTDHEPESAYDWVLVPGIREGEGSGHLIRMIGLAPHLPDPTIVLSGTRADSVREKFVDLSSYRTVASISELETVSAGSRDVVRKHKVFVVDQRTADLADIASMNMLGTVVGIDSVGPGTDRIAYIADLLPRAVGDAGTGAASPSNFAASHFNELPIRIRPTKAAWDKILVSFGGEDPGQLRKVLIKSGVLQTELPHATVEIQNGTLSPVLDVSVPGSWKVHDPRNGLKELFADYDVVITSFGLTALEARAAGCRVLLLNPSAYHERLGRKAGFESVGLRKIDPAKLRRIIASDGGLAPPQHSKQDPETGLIRGMKGLAAHLLSLERLEGNACPGCKSRDNVVIARFPDRSFYDCKTCGVRYMQLFGEQNISYNEAYFFDEYKKQYGKTYLDDFAHIKRMGDLRLDRVARANPRIAARAKAALGSAQHENAPTLFDIGCAYGPFLSAAHDRGYRVYGCDISPEAAGYVRDNLGFPAVSEDIRKLSPDTFGTKFDVVSMWYVIEHFPDLHSVMGTLNRLVKIGGVLSLSTPSGEGISAKARLSSFLNHSPRDHYSIWMPSRVNAILSLYGFRLDKVVSTGHHPERFPGPWSSKGLRGLSMAMSRLLNLGDTFELYAEKVRDLA